MTELRYEHVDPLTREELVKRLRSSDPQTVANALYAATRYEQDWAWVQEQCLEHLSSPDVPVRWAAATCLGDLAFQRYPLDVEAVLAALETASKDPETTDPANFSLSMVKQFLVST